MKEQLLKSSQDIGIELNQLRQEAKLTDLSFVCRKNDLSFHAIDAHQIIFSSLSAELTMLFDIVNQKQPYEKVVIILDSVNNSIMEKLIQCIYTGEINVNETEKQNLIQLCGLLKLDVSLTLDTEPDIENNEPSLEISIQSSCSVESHEFAYLEKGEPVVANRSSCNHEVDEIINSRETSPDVRLRETEMSEENFEAAEFDNESHNKENIIHQSSMTSKRKRKSVEKFQIQNKLYCEQYVKSTGKPVRPMNCKFCGTKISVTHHSYDLKKHMLLAHDKIRRFKCEKCSFSALKHHSLKQHNLRVHVNINELNRMKCSYSSAVKSTV